MQNQLTKTLDVFFPNTCKYLAYRSTISLLSYCCWRFKRNHFFFFTRFFSKPVFVLFIYNLSPSNYFENLKILTFFTFFRMLIGWVVIKYKNRVPVLCQWVKKTKIYNILHIDSHYSSNTVVYIFFILISFNRVRYFPIVKSPS